MKKFKIIKVWELNAENELKALELTKKVEHKRVIVQEIDNQINNSGGKTKWK